MGTFIALCSASVKNSFVNDNSDGFLLEIMYFSLQNSTTLSNEEFDDKSLIGFAQISIID